MTQEEYLAKCMSVANVLAKIAKGMEVSREERLMALKDAIEVLSCSNFPKE